jgi:hypothetical protein
MSDINNSNPSGLWSEVDDSNTAAPPNGFPIVSGSDIWVDVPQNGRTMMGALKRFWNRINGTVATAGSGNHYTYTPSNASFPTAYVQGETYSFKADRASTGGDDLNINNLGALPLFKATFGGLALIGAGDLQTGQVVTVQYDAALASGSGGLQVVSAMPAVNVGVPSLFINPFLEVAQEGPSGAVAVGVNTHSVDGWDILAAGAAVAWSKTGRVSGAKSNSSLTITGAASNTSVAVRQRLRVLSISSFYGVTSIAFVVRNDTGSAFTPSIEVHTCDAENNFSAVTQRFAQSTQQCDNNTTTRVFATVDISQLTNVSNGFLIQLVLPTVTNGTITITDAQANAGSIAMPIVSRGPSLEFQRCQSRFVKLNSTAGAFRAIGVGTCVSTTEIDTPIAFAAQMEVTPTLTVSSTGDFYFDNGTAASGGTFSFIDGDNTGGTVRCSGLSSLTVNTSRKLRANDTTTAFMKFDARP